MKNLAFCLCLMFAFSKAAEVFIGPNGDDNNLGTDASPFKTLTRAWFQANRTNDIVTFLPGEYTNFRFIIDVDAPFCIGSYTIRGRDGSATTIIKNSYVNLQQECFRQQKSWILNGFTFDHCNSDDNMFDVYHGLLMDDIIVQESTAPNAIMRLGNGTNTDQLTNCKFIHNQVSSDNNLAGLITATGDGVQRMQSGALVKVYNCLFDNNIIGNGAILNLRLQSPAPFTYVDLAGTIFRNNMGTPLAVQEQITEAKVRVVNCQFYSNTQIKKWAPGQTNDAGGGAINVLGNIDMFEVRDCVFGGNLALRGGAIYSNNFGATNITNCTFYDNKATLDAVAGPGGAVMFGTGAGNSYITWSTFRNNMGSMGGAVAYNGLQLSVSGSDFKSNQATLAGGALFVHLIAGSSQVDSSTFSDNSATQYGGTFAVEHVDSIPTELGNCPQFTLQNSNIRNSNVNVGMSIGGAIYMSNYVSTDLNEPKQSCYENGGFNLIETVIQASSARIAGGCIFANNVTLASQKSTLQGCTSARGAGIYATLVNMQDKGSKIQGNKLLNTPGDGPFGGPQQAAAIFCDKSKITLSETVMLQNVDASGVTGAQVNCDKGCKYSFTATSNFATDAGQQCPQPAEDKPNIAAIVIGVLGAVVGVSVIAYFLCRRKQTGGNQQQEGTDMTGRTNKYAPLAMED